MVLGMFGIIFFSMIVSFCVAKPIKAANSNISVKFNSNDENNEEPSALQTITPHYTSDSLSSEDKDIGNESTKDNDKDAGNGTNNDSKLDIGKESTKDKDDSLGYNKDIGSGSNEMTNEVALDNPEEKYLENSGKSIKNEDREIIRSLKREVFEDENKSMAYYRKRSRLYNTKYLNRAMKIAKIIELEDQMAFEEFHLEEASKDNKK